MAILKAGTQSKRTNLVLGGAGGCRTGDAKRVGSHSPLDRNVAGSTDLNNTARGGERGQCEKRVVRQCISTRKMATDRSPNGRSGICKTRADSRQVGAGGRGVHGAIPPKMTPLSPNQETHRINKHTTSNTATRTCYTYACIHYRPARSS